MSPASSRGADPRLSFASCITLRAGECSDKATDLRAPHTGASPFDLANNELPNDIRPVSSGLRIDRDAVYLCVAVTAHS